MQELSPHAPAPVIVSGVGRCGTSMLMQILEASGALVVGGTLPLYEQPIDTHIAREVLSGKRETFSPASGDAVKVLCVFLNRLDTSRAFRFIWLVRDPLQQAASQAKMASMATGYRSDGHDLKEMARHNMRLTVEGLHFCQEGFGDGTKVYSRRFEWCIEHPGELVTDLVTFLGLVDPDTAAMCSVVKERPTGCLREIELDLS